MNAASTVTAAFSTSSAASPTRISIYTNKRNALASPAKGGATSTKGVVDLSAMDGCAKGGAKNSKDVIDLSGKAGGAARILPVGAINSKLLTQSATIISNPSGPAAGAAQILQSNPINYKSQFYSAIKIHNSLVSAGGAGQVPQANAINDKSQSVSAIGIHHPSSHAGGAAQFPRANAINVGSQLVPAIGIHVPSSHAGGAAQFPQAHPINDKARPLMEGMAMNLENAPISAGGAGQFPDPNAINGMSPFFPSANINCPSDHAGGHAQLPQAHSAIANSRPLIEGAGPYSAFDLSLDKHHALIESEKLARRLLMVPIDGFIDNKEAT